jgi:predicted transcriptional regulator
MTIDPHTRREIAVAAQTTEESVRNFLRGASQKPILARRIRAEFERRGLTVPTADTEAAR